MTIPNIFGISTGAADIFGFAGMACIIFAYAYITASARPNPYIQHGVNLLGAALLTVSLTVNTNKASLVLEAFWAAIAIWGLAKALRHSETSSPSRLREGLGVGNPTTTGAVPPPVPPPSGRGEQ